jgi:hypothetical protein
MSNRFRMAVAFICGWSGMLLLNGSLPWLFAIPAAIYLWVAITIKEPRTYVR